MYGALENQGLRFFVTAFIFGALNLYLFVYMGFRGFYNCTQKRKHASC